MTQTNLPTYPPTHQHSLNLYKPRVTHTETAGKGLVVGGGGGAGYIPPTPPPPSDVVPHLAWVFPLYRLSRYVATSEPDTDS